MKDDMKFALSLSSILFSVLVIQAELHAAPPNVIYIMADDLGIGDVKCYGRDRCQINTPNFDRLAREGMRFTDAHSQASHCIPTRMAIMTGRYPWRFQRPRPDGRWGYLNPRIETTRLTLGKLMKQAGYRTGYIGKWHLGTQMQTTDGKNQGLKNVDYSKPIKIGPASYGFDYSWILPGSLDMYPYVYLQNHKFIGQVTAQKGWSAFNRVGPAAKDFQDHEVLDTFSQEAEQFIARQAKAAKDGKPFFLYFALTSPHTPISPNRKFLGKSRLGIYGDFVAETDDCIGRVLAALDKHGIAKNTLVIATSDHGAGAYAGNIRKATPNQIHLLEKKGHYSSGIYRGFKFSCYEGGLRVPFVVRWPKVVRPGSTCDRLVGLCDLMSTLADIGSIQLKKQDAPDSISFRRLLHRPSAAGLRSSLVMQSARSFVIRDQQWKLTICPGSGCNGRWGNRPRSQDAWRKAVKEFGKRARPSELLQAPFVQLFDMSVDPGETRNLAKQYPGKIRRLVAELERINRNGTSRAGQKLNGIRRVNILAGVPKFVVAK